LKVIETLCLPDFGLHQHLEAVVVKRSVVVEIAIKSSISPTEALSLLRKIGTILTKSTGASHVKLYDLTDLRYYRISIRGLPSPPNEEAFQRFMIVSKFPLEDLSSVTLFESKYGGRAGTVAILCYNVAPAILLKWIHLQNTLFLVKNLKVTWGPMQNPKYFRFGCIFCKNPGKLYHATHLCPKAARNPVAFVIPPELGIYGEHSKPSVATQQINWTENMQEFSGTAPRVRIVENFNAYDSFGSYVTPETPLETQNTNHDEPNTNASSSSFPFSFAESVRDPLIPAPKKKRKNRSQDKSEEN
jgi:hypothetical protein